jgi:serine/threonine kinase PknH
MTVFVSYSSRDRDAVKSLTQDLQDADEQVWMDQRLAGGEAWWRAILEQIRGCDVFIFALSQNSIESRPCQAELQYVQALELPILPVQVGPVDSMSLNPLATVQAIDYRHQTPNTGIRLIAALHRERARRQPLPSPLPEEPQVPFEYLIRLYTTISNPDYLSPRDQAALVAQLQVGLGEDGQHEAAHNDIVMLLTKLHDREDATHRTRTDVEAILASIGAQSPPQPSIGTENITPVEEQLGVTTPPVSTGPPADTGHEPADNDRTTPDRPTGTEPRTERDDHPVVATAPADELTSGHAPAKSLETPPVSPSQTSGQRPGEQPTQLAGLRPILHRLRQRPGRASPPPAKKRHPSNG